MTQTVEAFYNLFHNFLPGSQFSCISWYSWYIFTPFSPLSYQTCFWHCTACTVLLHFCALSSSVSERRTEKWRRERNTQARFRCPRMINSCFLQNVLKERGIHFVTPVIDFLSHWRQSPSRGWQALGSGVYRLKKMNDCMKTDGCRCWTFMPEIYV